MTVIVVGGHILSIGGGIFSIPSVGGPFDFYISTTGSDSNAGTLAAPWAITSLQDTNSNNSKITSKRVGMIAGTYATSGMQSGSTPNDFQHPVLHLPQGTSDNPTVVQSVSGPGTVVLDNSSSTTQNPLIGQNPTFAGFWTLDGIKILGSQVAQAFQIAGRYNAFSFTKSSTAAAFGITVQNCEISGMNITGPGGSNFGGMIMQGANGAIIKNNYIHDITKPTDEPHCHCYEEYGSQGSQIHFNTFANCPGGGIDLKAGVAGADVAFNYFYNVATSTPANAIAAITGADGAEGDPNSTTLPSATVHNNVFDSCGQAHTGDVNNQNEQNTAYYNNTIYDTRSGSNVGMDLRATTGVTVQYYNNIYVTTANSGGGSSGTLALSSGQWSIVDNNCYFYHSSTSGWGQSGTTFNTLASWKVSTNSPDPNSISANPQFVGTITPGSGASQFQLGLSSPCLGTGIGGVNMGAWDGTVTQIGSSI